MKTYGQRDFQSMKKRQRSCDDKQEQEVPEVSWWQFWMWPRVLEEIFSEDSLEEDIEYDFNASTNKFECHEHIKNKSFDKHPETFDAHTYSQESDDAQNLHSLENEDLDVLANESPDHEDLLMPMSEERLKQFMHNEFEIISKIDEHQAFSPLINMTSDKNQQIHDYQSTTTNSMTSQI
eukprot:403351943